MSDNKMTITGRCMYPHLFSPKKWDNKPEPQYEVAIVVPQNDPAVAQLWNHAAAMLQAAFPGLQPAMSNMPLSEDPNNPNIQGHYVIKTWTRQAPPVYRKNQSGGFDPIVNPSEVKDGDWVAVEVGLYTYDNMTKGVNAGLNSVLYLGPGQGALGRSGAARPEEAFANVQMPAGIAQQPPAAPAASPFQPQGQQPQQPVAQQPAPNPYQQPPYHQG